MIDGTGLNEAGAGRRDDGLSVERADAALRFDDVVRMARALCPGREHVLVLGGRLCGGAALAGDEARAVRDFAMRVVVAGGAPGAAMVGVPVRVEGVLAGVLVVVDPVAPVGRLWAGWRTWRGLRRSGSGGPGAPRRPAGCAGCGCCGKRSWRSPPRRAMWGRRCTPWRGFSWMRRGLHRRTCFVWPRMARG